MRDVIIIVDSCIDGRSGCLDLVAETIGENFVIAAENHDGDTWESKLKVEKVFSCLISSMGVTKAKELLDNFKEED